MSQIKLTEFSHGAGCGCKISPSVLETILKTQQPVVPNSRLLVGNSSRDDAAVYDLGDGTAVISTTDFFMPISDDPHTFGQIAAANAISDVYAMGGQPLMAIAILGWPVNVLDPEVAQQVVEGGRAVCSAAGIPLAGGHSIDSPEPIFGLAVTGRVDIEHLKRNDGAKVGDLLYLTKPLGIGILTTAQKQKKLITEHQDIAAHAMVQLNVLGQDFGKLPYVNAMTDVTGFGLLGHLTEMCLGAKVAAEIDEKAVPRFAEVDRYLSLQCVPGGTKRNIESYGHHLSTMKPEVRHLLCDPQTSGGLLVAVQPNHAQEFEHAFGAAVGQPIGKMVCRSAAPLIRVQS